MIGVFVELFQEGQFVGQVDTLGGSIQRSIADVTLWIDYESCRMGNAVMLQRIPEIEQVDHLFVLITEKGE